MVKVFLSSEDGGSRRWVGEGELGHIHDSHVLKQKHYVINWSLQDERPAEVNEVLEHGRRIQPEKLTGENEITHQVGYDASS